MSRRLVILVVDDGADDRLGAAITDRESAYLQADLEHGRLEILAAVPLPRGETIR